MTSSRYLIIAFTITIMLSVALGGLSLYHLNQNSTTVSQIYEHPFAVSNAGQSIETHILAMHRNMKDVVLLTSRDQLPAILKEIDDHEQAVMEEFNIIFDRFLGDKSSITQTYQTFLNWRPIRNEVLTLHALGNKEEAVKITKERGAEHVKRLQREVREFVIFAKHKAEEFYQKAKQERDQSILTVSIIAIISALGTTLIGLMVITSKKAQDKDTVQQNHLIDQNIMTATLDLDGNVKKISNALCRFLQTTKRDMLDKPSHFFENTSNRDDVVQNIFATIRTGKEWQGEICRINADGLQYFASSTVLPNFNEKFEIVGYTNILQDSTSKKLSVTDKLTTLHNRRAFEDVFEREVRLADRNSGKLTMAILDVDYFKLFNDNYGHPAGDTALREVADAIKSCLNRPNDYVFRIGGEEFAILLSDLDRAQSQTFLEVIRDAVESKQIPHEFSSVSSYLTVSIGAFVYSGMHKNSRVDIYNEADKALYLAKETRNTVVVHDRHE